MGRAFLESLVERGLQGVEFITSDDHSGLKAARKAVLPAARWQRCQPSFARRSGLREGGFHLAQNAIHHAPNQAIRKAIGEEPRAVWDAPSLESAEAELKRLVAGYRTAAPKLAERLENNVPEGFAVFKVPRDHWRRMRTSNPIERSIQQELKRRTQKIRVFPNEASLIRLVSAILAAKPSSTGGRPPPRNRCGCPRPPRGQMRTSLIPAAQGLAQGRQ